jgi:hypothetical protein
MFDINERHNPDARVKLDTLINGSYAGFVRLERRNLLLFSGITLISIFAGFSPDNFSFSGATFSNLSETSFFCILAVITFYFLTAFVIFSYPNYREAVIFRAGLYGSSQTFEYSVVWYQLLGTLWRTKDIRYFSWITMQYVLPCIVGVIAIVCAALRVIVDNDSPLA